MAKKPKKNALPESAELLAELATVDEVSAWIPTGADHDAGVTPPWCELVLEIRRDAEPFSGGPGEWPIKQRLPLRRHDGELVIQVLNDVLRPEAATFAGDAIWEELDAVVERIQVRVNKGKDPTQMMVGQALGLATALAYLSDAIEPDIDEVRAVAMTRYAIRHGLDVSEL